MLLIWWGCFFEIKFAVFFSIFYFFSSIPVCSCTLLDTTLKLSTFFLIFLRQNVLIFVSDTCANCHTAANCNWKLCSHVTAGTFLTCLVCKILLSILYDVAKFLVLCLSLPVPDLLRYELFFCHVLINFSKFRVLCWSHNHFRTIHSLDVRTNFVPSLLCLLWHSHAPSCQVLDVQILCVACVRFWMERLDSSIDPEEDILL